jgi:hypothetical protein
MKNFKNKTQEEVDMYNPSIFSVLQLLVRFLLLITKPELSAPDVEQMRVIFVQVLSFFPDIDFPIPWSANAVCFEKKTFF